MDGSWSHEMKKKTLAVLARKVMWQLIFNHGNKYKMTVFLQV